MTSPADGASGLGTQVTLTWQSVPGANSYEVILGTVNPPLVRLQSVWAPTATAVVNVNPGTSYFWKVKAYPGCGTSAGSSSPVRAFTTASAARSLTTVSPTVVNR